MLAIACEGSAMPRSTMSTLTIASLLGLGPSLALAYALFWPGADGLDPYGYPVIRDFLNFWTGGRLAFSGRVAEIYDLQAYEAAVQGFFAPMQHFMNFSYPPHTLPLLLPVGALPHPLAAALWVLFGLVAFVLAALGWPIPANRRALIVVVLLSPVAILNAAIGQAGSLLALAFVAGFRLLPRRAVGAGVLFGLLTVKPHLGLLIPIALVLRRAWTAIAAAAATTIALIALSLLLYGVEPWQAFFANTVVYQKRVVIEMVGFYTTMMYSPYALFWWLGFDTGPAMTVHVAVALPVAILALAAVRRTHDAPLATAIIAFAAVIVPPYSLCYDLAIPAAALANYLVHRTAPLDWPARVAVGAFWIIPFVTMALTLMGVPIAPVIVLAMFACLVREARAEAAAPAAGASRPAPA
jgi:hypothetical protein